MALFEIDWRPSARQLRAFGAITAMTAAVIATWVFWRHSLAGFDLGEPAARITAFVLWGVGVACLVLLAAPLGLWPLYVLLNAAAIPIGFVLSYLILFVLFFFVFTPMALVFRLVGRDGLHRKFDRGAASYWQPCEGRPHARRYFRQY